MRAFIQATKQLTYSLLFVGGIVLFAWGPIHIAPTAQARPAYLRQVRAIELKAFDVADPAGLTYSPAANALLVLEDRRAARATSRVMLITPFEAPAGAWDAPAGAAGLAFDPNRGRLLMLDPTALDLVGTQPPAGGVRGAALQVHSRVHLRQLGLDAVHAIALDADAGRLFLLDAGRPRVIALDLGALDGASTARPRQIDLSSLPGARPRQIAFNPADGHLYVLDDSARALYALDADGRTVATRDLAPLQIGEPRGMVFAPSGDPTDDPAATSLYIAAAGPAGTSARIVELELEAPTLSALPASMTSAALVRTIDTSHWSPPSPDPSGITYLPSSGRLLISDSEVDEMPIFAGANLFESTRAGGLEQTYSTLAFSNEPSDVATDGAGRRLFFTDDNQKKVFEVDLGVDGVYGTADDTVTSFSTQAFNSADPEGLAFGEGKLFIADGLGQEIYIVDSGSNGRFDGVAPTGDDQVTHFDTARLDQTNPEDVEYNSDRHTLFIVSNKWKSNVTETTLSGEVVQVIDLSFMTMLAPAGLAYAPGSQKPSEKHLYIVDRGRDNNNYPNENDGKLYEIAFGSQVPTHTPTPTHTPKPTATPRPTRTPAGHQTYVYLPMLRRR